LLQYAPISTTWIENQYANGIYATLSRTLVPLSNRVPFAIGDLIVVAIVVGLVIFWAICWNSNNESRHSRLAKILLRTGAVLAFVAIWFDVSWALNYRRLPIINRIAFNSAQLTPTNVSAFSAHIVTELNRTAPQAHAVRETETQMEADLAAAEAPVLRRLGNRYDSIPSYPKRTIFNWWFSMAGVGGQWDPFAYETLLNADFLPFERPFALAHERGHVAGFGDETDANLIGALTTLRSKNPLIRYSGLFWVYGFLPESDRRRLAISPLVAADLTAARDRFLRTYNPHIYDAQWYIYDKYLRANRVSAGIVSYSLFVEVLVGTPLDHEGLPVVHPAI